MANKLKPIPKNQSELTQQRIEPYLTNQGSNSNGEDIFYKNRGIDRKEFVIPKFLLIQSTIFFKKQFFWRFVHGAVKYTQTIFFS
jgi:hypothetical protein